jgi:uncharacterized membrane-anchored protein
VTRFAAGRPEPRLRYSAPMGWEHTDRRDLNDEVHARPPLRIAEPALVTHLAYQTGEQGAARDFDHMIALCRQFAAPVPPPGARQWLINAPDRVIRWERHTEFATLTHLAPDPDPAKPWPDLPPALITLMETLPAPCLVAVNLRVESAAASVASPERLGAIFNITDLVGATTGGEDAEAWTDFRIAEDGFSRILIRNRTLTAGRLGRMVQRLLEIETYRMMALLGLSTARTTGPELARMERQLADIVSRTAIDGADGNDHKLLEELTGLAAESVTLASRSRYRFSATAAYADLVEDRIEELREGRIEGWQRIGVFLDRRFRPAIKTCSASLRRQDELAQGIAQASNMLRTRVDVKLEEQNGALLRAMEERSRAQLRIQQAVEGLSVFAISYYLLAILKILMDGVFPESDHRLLGAIAVPVVLAAVWFSIRRLRHALKK